MGDKFVAMAMNIDVKGLAQLGLALGCVQAIAAGTVMLVTTGVTAAGEKVKQIKHRKDELKAASDLKETLGMEND